MQQVNGIWLPADEHLKKFLETGPIVGGKGTYQFHKYVQAMTHVTSFRHAVDVGAHVGTWSRLMAMWFDRLTAFEPLQFHRDCYVKNVDMGGRCVVTLVDTALGTEAGMVRLHVPDVAVSSGGSHVKVGKAPPEGDSHPHSSRMIPLDSMGLTEVDFLKIDCEGFELNVLKGGEETVRRWKPTIIVEQKPGHGQRYGYGETEALDLLASWGADLVWTYSGDYVLRWMKR